MTENKRFTYDSKTVSILKDGEFWLDGNVDTACNHKEICELLNELNDENKELKEERKGFESCSHNWGILYDEAKNKVEELSKENRELRSDRDYWKTLAQSLAKTNGKR